jgi:hypothetical protein
VVYNGAIAEPLGSAQDQGVQGARSMHSGLGDRIVRARGLPYIRKSLHQQARIP